MTARNICTYRYVLYIDIVGAKVVFALQQLKLLAHLHEIHKDMNWKINYIFLIANPLLEQYGKDGYEIAFVGQGYGYHREKYGIYYLVKLQVSRKSWKLGNRAQVTFLATYHDPLGL